MQSQHTEGEGTGRDEEAGKKRRWLIMWEVEMQTENGS